MILFLFSIFNVKKIIFNYQPSHFSHCSAVPDLSSCPPITALGPCPVWVEGSVPFGGTTPDLPPVDQTPHMTLT